MDTRGICTRGIGPETPQETREISIPNHCVTSHHLNPSLRLDCGRLVQMVCVDSGHRW